MVRITRKYSIYIWVSTLFTIGALAFSSSYSIDTNDAQAQAGFERLVLSNKRIVFGNRGVQKRCRKKKLKICPIATTLYYKLSGDGDITVTIEKCNKMRNNCRSVAGFNSYQVSGQQSYHFNSRVGRKWLRPGNYRIVINALIYSEYTAFTRKIRFKVI